MTGKKRRDIRAAADLLGLGETASLAEIKKAYRRLSKEHHPDMNKPSTQKSQTVEMHKISEAYEILLKYCAGYRFPLNPEDREPLEGDDWWFERFGQDHHWGKGSVGQGESDE